MVSSHVSRGIRFQNELRKSADVLPGVILYKLEPVPGRRNRSPLGHIDYVGHIFSVPVALEAKSTSGTTFRLQQASEVQIEELLLNERTGAVSGLLIRFGLNRPRVLFLPTQILASLLESGVGSIRCSEVCADMPFLEIPRMKGIGWNLHHILLAHGKTLLSVGEGKWTLSARS